MPVHFKPHTYTHTSYFVHAYADSYLLTVNQPKMNWCNDNHYIRQAKPLTSTYNIVSNFKRRFIRCLVSYTHTYYILVLSLILSVFCLAVPMNKRALTDARALAIRSQKNKKKNLSPVFYFLLSCCWTLHTYTRAPHFIYFYFLANDTIVALMVLLSLSLLLLRLLLLIVM